MHCAHATTRGSIVPPQGSVPPQTPRCSALHEHLQSGVCVEEYQRNTLEYSDTSLLLTDPNCCNFTE